MDADPKQRERGPGEKRGLDSAGRFQTEDQQRQRQKQRTADRLAGRRAGRPFLADGPLLSPRQRAVARIVWPRLERGLMPIRVIVLHNLGGDGRGERRHHVTGLACPVRCCPVRASGPAASGQPARAAPARTRSATPHARRQICYPKRLARRVRAKPKTALSHLPRCRPLPLWAKRNHHCPVSSSSLNALRCAPRAHTPSSPNQTLQLVLSRRSTPGAHTDQTAPPLARRRLRCVVL